MHNDFYFSRAILYIHANPQKHGFIKDYRDYPYSSYWSHLSKKNTKLKREEVLEWFGNEEEYVKFHKFTNFMDMKDDFIIEFD